jgi:Rrf2 family transcriptional repressor of oqxAB
MIDVRFPTALQMMLSLALAQERGQGLLTSSQLARSLGANPSFLRKVLVPLTEAGLVEAARGNAGGVRLTREASEITLRDVYEAVSKDKPFWAPRGGVPSVCLVSSNISEYFSAVSASAQQSTLASLGESTLADGLARLHTLDAQRSPGP